MQNAMVVVQRARVEVCADNTEHVKVLPSGGRWTLANRSVAMDAWQGKHTNAVAPGLCPLYNFWQAWSSAL